MVRQFCSPSHAIHAASSLAGISIGCRCLKKRCRWIGKSIFGYIAQTVLKKKVWLSSRWRGCIMSEPPEPHGPYRVEIGYYQPAEVWHSVAMSNEIVMPPHGITETEDVDLVTIPFHLSFQQLLDLFGPANNTELATVISQFQKRTLSSEGRARLSPEEKRILRKLDVSLSDIAAARRAFDEADSEKLARRTGALLAFGSSSPSGGFEGHRASAGP